MLETAVDLPGPSSIRFPKTPAHHVGPGEVGSGLSGRRTRQGDGTICFLGVGKMLEACEQAAEELAAEGIDATVWDVRVVSPPDPEMLADAARSRLVVTAEDGVRIGGAGSFLVDAMGAHSPHQAPRPLILGVPRAYLAQGKADAILRGLGLDGPGIAASVREALSGGEPAAEDVRQTDVERPAH
jgi:1-deoxy-D-xylulose-5-phosphate synthase